MQHILFPFCSLFISFLFFSFLFFLHTARRRRGCVCARTTHFCACHAGNDCNNNTSSNTSNNNSSSGSKTKLATSQVGARPTAPTEPWKSTRRVRFQVLLGRWLRLRLRRRRQLRSPVFFLSFVIYFKFLRGIKCNEKRAEKCSISKKYARDNYNDCKTWKTLCVSVSVCACECVYLGCMQMAEEVCLN